MTRRRARHMRRVGEHMPCRTRRCMRHGTSNANGHGMPCDEGFPISAASTDTVGRIPPTCQHLMLRVSSEEGSSLFCTLLFQKNLDRSKLWSFSYLDFRYRNPKRAGWYRGWGVRGIGPQKPGRRRATTPPPMAVATKRDVAMQGPLKQCR